MTREEYIQLFVDRYGFPLSRCQQANDMASQAFNKAMQAAEATINLHHDADVRDLATIMMVDAFLTAMHDRKETAGILLAVLTLQEKAKTRES